MPPIKGDTVYCWPDHCEPLRGATVCEYVGIVADVTDTGLNLHYLLPDGANGLAVVPLRPEIGAIDTESPEDARVRLKGKWWPRPAR